MTGPLNHPLLQDQMGTKSNSNIKAKLSRREDPRSTNYPVLIFVLWEVGAYVRRKLSLPTDEKYPKKRVYGKSL